jgi:ferredoxin
MAPKYRIDQGVCVQCAACVPECPVNAITPDAPFVIDPEICTDCGACSPVCPVEAISQYEYGPPPGDSSGQSGTSVGMGMSPQ